MACYVCLEEETDYTLQVKRKKYNTNIINCYIVIYSIHRWQFMRFTRVSGNNCEWQLYFVEIWEIPLLFLKTTVIERQWIVLVSKTMLFQLCNCTIELRKSISRAKETMWVCIASIEMFQVSVDYLVSVPVKQMTCAPHTPCWQGPC